MLQTTSSPTNQPNTNVEIPKEVNKPKEVDDNISIDLTDKAHPSEATSLISDEEWGHEMDMDATSQGEIFSRRTH